MPRHAKHIENEGASKPDIQTPSKPETKVDAVSSHEQQPAGSPTFIGASSTQIPPSAPLSPEQPRRTSKGLKAFLAIVIILIVLAAGCIAILVFQPSFAEKALEAIGIVPTTQSADAQSHDGLAAVNDAELSKEQRETIEHDALEAKRTPIVAQCAGIDLHSPIAMADLTGILFHQASNEYALIISTDLPEADYDTVEENSTMRINHDQVGEEGAWADTEALHLWRDSDDTEMDTSIDIGAYAETTVYSPVDGTVVLIRDYRLYDDLDDIEIHIQPKGRPDLDVVLIHTYDPLVSVGDTLQAGLTPISHVRDIEKDLTDVQLGFFTPEGVGGNHTHVQVNDTNFGDYRERRLSGAIDVKD